MAAKLVLLVLALLMTYTVPAVAQTASRTAADPIRYTLSFPAPHTHYVEVSAEVPTGRRAEVELMMAVWTPGSYLIREYERQVEGVTATGAGGSTLAVSKASKNHWRITT